jgi:hypothetical protein
VVGHYFKEREIDTRREYLPSVETIAYSWYEQETIQLPSSVWHRFNKPASYEARRSLLIMRSETIISESREPACNYVVFSTSEHSSDHVSHIQRTILCDRFRNLQFSPKEDLINENTVQAVREETSYSILGWTLSNPEGRLIQDFKGTSEAPLDFLNLSENADFKLVGLLLSVDNHVVTLSTLAGQSRMYVSDLTPEVADLASMVAKIDGIGATIGMR